MLAIVVSFLLLPAIFNAQEVGGEDLIQASVRLLEDQLEGLYAEKAESPAISRYEAELSELYNIEGESRGIGPYRCSHCTSPSKCNRHRFCRNKCEHCRHRGPFPEFSRSEAELSELYNIAGESRTSDPCTHCRGPLSCSRHRFCRQCPKWRCA